MHRTTDTAPIRVLSLPSVQRASSEALTYLQKAPRRQLWNIGPRKETRS